MQAIAVHMTNHQLYLFSTHMTKNKEIAIAAVVVVAVVAVGFWMMRRRRSQA
jgi:hypothetical protein